MKKLFTFCFAIVALMLQTSSTYGQCSDSRFFGFLTGSIDYSISAENAICASIDDGSVTLADDFSGITSNVSQSYSWSNGATTRNLTGIGAGTYTVTVTTNWSILNSPTNTCITIKTINVSAGGCCLDTDISVTNACPSEGSATVTALNGTGPYDYIWSTGASTINTSATTATLTGLSTGTYRVTVTDQNCSKEVDFSIIDLGSADVSVNQILPVSCNGGSDGSAISVAIKGAITFADHTYEWSGPNGYSETHVNPSVFGASADVIEDLFAGTYSVTVTDQDGCTATASGVVTEPAPLAISSVIVNPSCNGDADGSLEVTASGGNAATYLYQWSTSDPDEIAASSKIEDLTAGDYTVTVTSGLRGCQLIESITVDEPGVLQTFHKVSANGNFNISLNGGMNGWINTLVKGGNGGGTFSWTGPNGFTSSNKDISSLKSGSYFVKLIDSKGCETSEVLIFLSQP